jgi:hypothetical protein
MPFTPVTDPRQLRKIFLVAKNLEPGTTSKEFSEFLFTTIGLDVPPEKISCKDVAQSFANAFVEIDCNVLADFINRYLEGQHIAGRLVEMEPKLWKQDVQRSEMRR